MFYYEIKRTRHGRIPDEKTNFLKNLGFFLMKVRKLLILLKVISFQWKLWMTIPMRKPH